VKDHAERATRLLALAASTSSQEEARTAALTAALLIAKHGLKVVSDVPSSAADDYVNDADPMDVLRRMWRERERRQEELFREGFNRGFYGEQAKAQAPTKPPTEAPPGGSWVKVIGTKQCSKCGVHVEHGQSAYSVKHGGAWQYWCQAH
jgi:hypothetical protein